MCADELLPDPRPDLTADSVHWRRLLTAAAADRADPHGLYGVLDGVRCCGAALRVEDGRLRLTAGELAAAEYALIRERDLRPHTATLRALLRQVSLGAVRGGKWR